MSDHAGRAIYLTHCSAKKDDELRSTGRSVGPDTLYISEKTQRFIRRCKTKGVDWAIFSDQYGIWFPNELHGWYEKDPNNVTEHEFAQLLQDFDEKLGCYERVFFYHHPARFHPLYKRLIQKTRLGNRVRLIKHLEEIG